ncbi:g7705 [Coccomyxa elongata]
MYSRYKSLSSPPSQVSRQVVHLGYRATNSGRSRRAESSRVLCTSGDGGVGGCPRGAAKFTAAEEPGRPRKLKVLLGSLTFEKVSLLALPTALFTGLYCVAGAFTV